VLSVCDFSSYPIVANNCARPVEMTNRYLDQSETQDGHGNAVPYTIA
jgi:hypothetical protein